MAKTGMDLSDLYIYLRIRLFERCPCRYSVQIIWLFTDPDGTSPEKKKGFWNPAGYPVLYSLDTGDPVHVLIKERDESINLCRFRELDPLVYGRGTSGGIPVVASFQDAAIHEG